MCVCVSLDEIELRDVVVVFDAFLTALKNVHVRLFVCSCVWLCFAIICRRGRVFFSLLTEKTRGFSTFGVSPDGKRVCLMQQDLSTGFYTISVMEGEKDALDPRSTATMEQVKTYHERSIPHALRQGSRCY